MHFVSIGRRLDRVEVLLLTRLENGDRVNTVASPVAVEWYFSNYSKIHWKNYFFGPASGNEIAASMACKIFVLGCKCRQGISVVGGTGSR